MHLTTPLLLWALLPLGGLVWMFERRLPGTRARKWLRGTLRFAVLTAALVALAGPTTPLHTSRRKRVVVLVDVSLGMDARAQGAAWDAAHEAVAGAWRAKHPVTVVPFDAVPRPAHQPAPGDPWPPRVGPAGGRASLAAGLAGAALAFAEDEVGRVLLISNGRGDARGVRAAHARLTDRGIQVQALAVPKAPKAATARPEFVAVDAPESARGAFRVRAQVDTQGREVRVTLHVDGESKATLRVAGGATTPAVFDLTDLQPGTHELLLSLEAPGDAGAAPTDTARRLVQVGAAPRVLALLHDPERAALRRALSAQGMQIDAVPPEGASAALTHVKQPHDLVALDAISAAQIPTEAQRILVRRIRDGLGLLLTAGSDKAAWEALRGMPLAEVLPVQPRIVPEPEPDKPAPAPEPPPTPPPEPPEDDDGPGIEAVRQPAKAYPITLLLVIDRSESMTGEKLKLALEGAARAAATLSPWDRIGVITFATKATLTVPPQSAERAAELPMWLGTVQAAGGTDIFRALRLAGQVLARETTPIQHLILLSDGRTHGIKLWHDVVGPMGRRGVTMTMVGLGPQHRRSELRDIMQWAARATLVSVYEPKDLPTILTRDTRGLAQRRDAEAERLDRLHNPDRKPDPAPAPSDPETVAPPLTPPETPDPSPPEPAAEQAAVLKPLTLVRPHEAVRGFTPETLPQVGPPQAGDPVVGAITLLAREEEPVLAARRVGLGRVIVWQLSPEDAGSRAFTELGRLFGQCARAVMAPEGAFRYLPRVVVTRTPDGDQVHVAWPPGDATGLTLSWTGANGQTQALGRFEPGGAGPVRALPDTAPGRRARIEATLDDGRQVAPLSYLVTAPAPTPSMAGDAAGLASLFGDAPLDPARIAHKLTGGSRRHRRPLWMIFLWIAIALLPLDVFAHRRSVAT